MKTINILGDTQREQWHNFVNIIWTHWGLLDRKALKEILDEIDRYIDHAEDIFDELRKEEKK